jgi:hypothetical protein
MQAPSPPHPMARAAETLSGLRFHHLGLAVGSPEEAFLYLGALGYTEGAREFDPIQGVHLAMRHHSAMPDVEVIWPGDGPTPIDKFVKRMGTMIYHLCYECSEPDRVIAALEMAGLETALVSPPMPAVLFGGREVSFHMVSGFGLIELLCSA